MGNYNEEDKKRDLNTPVAAPTLKPMPTEPTYDNTKWDDTEKGSAALGAYNSALDAVKGHGPFQYINDDQYNAVMDKILNREKFSYDFNGDALYQQYKDKYIQQGKLAMEDAMGQAAAMTGGYGNSYAQSVGQQAYQAQLGNLNDIIPELYQMALDKYNTEGQDLLNQYGMLAEDRTRAYGEHQDEYNKLKDALSVARGDYYDGADMFHKEQSNANTIAGREFDDAMSIWENESNNAWKQATWDEDARRYERGQLVDSNESESAVVDEPNTTPENTIPAVSDSIIEGLKNYTTRQGQADYLAELVNSGKLESEEEAAAILDEYGVVDLLDRTWEVVEDGDWNVFGIGINANAKVRDQYGNEYTLAELRKELCKTMKWTEAQDKIKELEKKLGIRETDEADETN